jgi:uncharacterized phage protein (TIGR02216 family)
MTPFPWRAAMGFGFGVLRLPPVAFWGMTPRELAAAIDALRGSAPESCSRDALTALIAAFPDFKPISAEEHHE